MKQITIALCALILTSCATTNRPDTVPMLATESREEIERKQAIFAEIVAGVLGDGKVHGVAYDPWKKGRYVHVTFHANGGFTRKMILFDAQRDMVGVLSALEKSEEPFDFVTVRGLFPIVDKSGKPRNVPIVFGGYSRETVERINWSNFLTQNIIDVADYGSVHPAFAQ